MAKSMQQEIKETLESEGMKHIVRGLRAHHKAAWRAYRKCGSVEQMLNLQTIQTVIDTTLPQIIENLMNAHIHQVPNHPVKKEWFFEKWIQKIRFRRS